MPTTATTDRAALSPFPLWDALSSALDALGADPLDEGRVQAHIRPLFSRVLERDGIYLGNHSLGRPLDQTALDVSEAMDLWYREMDGAWGPWMEAQEQYRCAIARLIGAPNEACVVPKTNAGQGLRAVLNAMPVRRPNVVATRNEFDSIDVILKTYQMRDRASVSWVEPDDDGLIDPDRVIQAISYATDVVMISQIFYASGQTLGRLEDIINQAHQCHAVVVLDTYHSAGVIPMDLAGLGVDFAIGGNYKYTRGGPGACWLMIHPRHNDMDRVKRTLDTGWFAKKDVFDYSRRDVPAFAEGADGWLESTPPFLLPYQAKAGLTFTLTMGVDRLRAYALSRLAYLDERLRGAGVRTLRRDPMPGFLLVPDDDAPALCARLHEEHGLTADARMGCVRLCPDVLTTTAEMDEAARIVAHAKGR